MRYLTVSSFGTALGLSGERLVVHEADGRNVGDCSFKTAHHPH